MATVVVTRTLDDAGKLADLLRARGHGVVEVPSIRIVDEPGGVEALRAALDRGAGWAVVTSRHGADRLAVACDGRLGAQLAVVGSATARRCGELGLPVAVVPDRFLAEGLLERFGPPDGSTVVVAQAAGAAPTLADGLRAKGWDVEVAVTYRSEPVEARPELAAAIATADAITFTSGSTVTNFVAAYGPAAVPPIVVCIGPVTQRVAVDLGLVVDAVAEPHTVEGLVAAVDRAVAT